MNQWTEGVCQLNGRPICATQRGVSFTRWVPWRGPDWQCHPPNGGAKRHVGWKSVTFPFRQNFSRQTEASRLELEQKGWKQKAYICPFACVGFRVWVLVYTAAQVASAPCANRPRSNSKYQTVVCLPSPLQAFMWYPDIFTGPPCFPPWWLWPEAGISSCNLPYFTPAEHHGALIGHHSKTFDFRCHACTAQMCRGTVSVAVNHCQSPKQGKEWQILNDGHLL